MLLFSASLKKTKFQFFEICLRPTENVMKAIFSEDDLSDEFFLRKCRKAMNSFFGNVEKRLNIQAHAT
jgi:hypothetical protein